MPDLPIAEHRITTGPLPASTKIHLPGAIHPDIRVAMREIAVSGGEAPLRVYDTSGPYTDPDHLSDIAAGLPALRAGWIAARGDVVRAARHENVGFDPRVGHGRGRECPDQRQIAFKA